MKKSDATKSAARKTGLQKHSVLGAGLLAALCALPASSALAQFSDFQESPWQGGVNHFYGTTLVTAAGTFSNSGALTYNTSTLPPDTGPLFGWDLTPGVTRSGDYYYGVGVLNDVSGGTNTINNNPGGTMQGIVTGYGQGFGVGLYAEGNTVTINNSDTMDGEVWTNDGTAAGVYATGTVNITNNAGATCSAAARYYAGGIYTSGGGAQTIVNNGTIKATATGGTQGNSTNQAYCAGIDVFTYDPNHTSPIYVVNNGLITISCTGGATNTASCAQLWAEQSSMTFINNGILTASVQGSQGAADGMYIGADNGDCTFYNTGTINNGGGPGGQGVWIENDSAVGNIRFSNSGTIASGEPFAVAIANYSSGPYGYAYVTNTGTISGGWLGLGWNGMDFYDSGDIHTGLAWLGDNCHVYISGLPTIDPTLGAGGSGTNNTLVFNLTGTLQSVNGQSASGTNLSAFALGTNGSIVVSGKTYRWSNFGSVFGTAIPATPLLAGPTGLTATAVSGSQVNLAWNGLTNATSYNVKRSTTSFGPYTTIASGVAATNYADTAAFAGVEYYYVVSAMVGGSETANGAEVALPYSKLTGAIIGTPGSWNNSGNTITNVFDNNLNTFFDAPTGNGDWVGLYFGGSVSNAITQINYCPRSGFEGRMVGGIFQGANLADFSDAVTLYTVTAQPPSGVFTSASITNTSAFRYVRYLSPNGGYGNVAELQFYGYLAGASVPLPAAPGGLAAAAVSGSQINLGWNVVTNAASYNVKRSTTNGGPYVIIATGVIATNYYDAGLMSGTTYYYVVSAVNAGGESANSVQAGVTPASNPPAPWMKLDIGTVGASGSASFTNGLFMVVGAGADIWNTADAFRFVYVPVTGDCTMVARVASVQNIDSWSKAGVMIRESLNANAANAFTAVTPGNGVTWQYRASTGGGGSNNNTPGLNAPYWVKLVRSGNTFTGYYSPNGTSWTQLGSQTFTMASTAYIGMAVTSHNNSALCAALFDNVTAPGWPSSLPPPPPANLAATGGSGQVVLNWAASSTAASYNVKRSTTNGGPYAVVANVTTTNYTDAALVNGTTYYYVVSALNPAGESTNSPQASAMPQTSVPTGLSATGVSSSQINLIWNLVTNATGYNVKRSATNGGPYSTIATGVTATNYPDSGLAGGTIYYYVVSAIVSGTEGPNSAPAATATFSPTLGSLVHRYSFSETGGVTVADSVGGPVWAGTLPNGGTLSDGQLTLSASLLQYVSLPPGIVSSLSNVTVMAWVNLASVSYWSRIFDFGNDTTTYMFLTPRNGFDYTARFAISTSGAGGEQKINCPVAVSPGGWHQVAVSLNSGTGILYVDGVAVGTNSSLTLNPSSLGSTTHNYLGKSRSPSDPYLNGSFDEFRIYNVGLSAAEIAAAAALGPDQLLSTNPPPLSLGLIGTNLTVSWPVANAGFTLQSCTNLASGNWVNVTSAPPQIVGNQWQVALPLPGDAGSAFFRLSK